MGDQGVVIITGASTGIGRACAEYLGGRGYRVYGTSRHASREPVVTGAFSMVRMDVTDTGSVKEAIDLVAKREGRIDAVFNNAGIHSVGPIEELPFEQIEASFQTNCFGAMRVCQAVIPIMRAQGGGRIINISSVAGVIALPFQAAYSGSKFALEAMTEAMRAEVRRFGIKVSLIEPGDIRHQDCHTETAPSGVYEPYFSNAVHVAWADEEKGYAPEKIGPLVQKILRSPNPGLRYLLGQTYQSAAIALKRRVLPDRAGAWAIATYYKT